MRLGIQKKLTLNISGFLIIIFALILWGFLSYSIRLTRDNIQKQQFAMTELIARGIDDKLGTYLATIAQVAAEVKPDYFANPEKGQGFLDMHRGLISIFDNGIFLFDANGTLISECPYMEGRRGMKAHYLLPFFKNVQMNDFPDISYPYLSPKSNEPAIAMAAPISDHNGRQLGFLVGSINLNRDYFVEELMGYKIGEKGYLYLFNTERTMILHPDKKRIMKRDVPPGVNKLYDKAIQGFEGSGETVNSRGIRQIASFKRLKTVDWILASAYPQDEAYAPITRIRTYLIAAATLVTLFSVVWIWLLTKRTTSNLSSFTSQIRHIREHPEGSHLIHIDSNDEVALLSASFNDLMNELNMARETLDELTRTDHLTGLFNRRHLEMEAPKLIALSDRKHLSTAVVMVDIDHFKKINDTYGHETGDEVLFRLAIILNKAVRPYDLVVRYGGEEFLVLLPMCGSQEAMEIGERIRRTIQNTPIVSNNQNISITVSIGIYVADRINDFQDAVAQADAALYEAKNNGRNRVCLAPIVAE